MSLQKSKSLPKNDPFEQLAEVPGIEVRAAGFKHGDTLPMAQVGASHGGEERSPELSWDAVEGAKSYAVTCYDPDAPTMSGFWHWAVYNLPAETAELAEGAGSGDLADLPAGSALGYNEALERQYIGAAPPAGHGPHRYYFTVTALDTRLDLPDNLTVARLNFMMREHVIARGHIMGVFEQPAQ